MGEIEGLEELEGIEVEAAGEEPAPSPFIEGTKIQYAWDATSLGMLKRCPQLYEYIMIQGWQPKEDNVHLYFGIEYHQALQDYDILKSEGQSHEDALRSVVHELMIRIDNWESDHKLKNRRTLIRSVIWYLEHYKNDAAKTILLSDGTPAVELSFKFELDYGPTVLFGEDEDTGEDKVVDQPYLLCGHLDRVVEFNGQRFVMDRKTTSITPGQYYFDQFSPENQMSLYTLAGGIVLDTPIRGVIVDAVQIAEGYTFPQRGFTYRTPDQLDEWMTDLAYWLNLAEYYAENNHWPKNDTACDKYGGCKFREICSKSPQVREKFLKSNFVQLPVEARWNPLKPR